MIMKKLTLLTWIACLAQATSAHSQENAPSTAEGRINQIINEVQQLKQVNAQLYQRIQYLENQLQQLAPPRQKTPEAQSGQEQQVARQQSRNVSRPQESAQQTRRSPEQSRGAVDVIQEEHTLFDQSFSLELGFEYSRFDRSQLVLNGFLALDAIFLGEISIDEVEADIWTTSLTARWGLTDRLQLNMRVPWVYRETTFRSGGQQLSSILVSEESVSDSDIGDISLGMSYQLFKETPTRPDMVLNFSATAPTGREPYGIKFLRDDDFTDPESNTNLQVPTALPTGSGLWALTAGVSFLRTIDPAIIFANIAYTHYLENSFSDITSDPDQLAVPGKVQLGDRYRFTGGLAFALNERSSLSFAFTQEFFQSAEVTRQDQATQDIVGSKASTGNLDLGFTYALTNQLSMISNLGVGLNQDASDYSFSLRFPYRF